MFITKIEVQDMACGMCESHINDVVRKTCNIKSVKSSHKKNLTEITSEQKLDLPALKKAIKDTGYTVGKITEEEMEEKKKKFLFW